MRAAPANLRFPNGLEKFDVARNYDIAGSALSKRARVEALLANIVDFENFWNS